MTPRKSIQKSVNLANMTESALDHVAQAIENMQHQVGQVAEASQKQVDVVDDVSLNINQLNVQAEAMHQQMQHSNMIS